MPQGEESHPIAPVRLDAAAQDALRQVLPQLDGKIGTILNGLYAHPEVAEQLRAGAETNAAARLAELQAAHWRSLFEPGPDGAAASCAEAVGRAHAAAGIALHWYVEAHRRFLQESVAAVLGSARRSMAAAGPLDAVLRTVMSGFDLALGAYVEAGEEERAKRQMRDLADLLDRELGDMIDGIGFHADRLNLIAAQMDGDAGHLYGTVEHARGGVTITRESVQEVAGAVGQIEASAAAIAEQVRRSAALAGSAAQQAERGYASVLGLSEAAGQIAQVVDLVRTIATQTRLLALNANIEAARAGEAGRGFAVVADEVKRLARQTEAAIGSVNQHAAVIGRATQETVGAIQAVVTAIREIDAGAGAIAAAAAEQSAAISAISRSAAAAADETATVDQGIGQVSEVARSTGETAARVRALSGRVVRDVEDVRRLLTVLLRGSAVGNRRAEQRVPVAIPVACVCDGRDCQGITADLSTGGTLLRIGADATLAGKRIAIDIEGIGGVAGTVVAVTTMGCHVQFAKPDPERLRRIVALLRKVREEDQTFIDLAKDAAGKVAAAFEAALAEGAVAAAELFDIDYVPVAGTDPPQYLTRFTALADRLLPPIQEPLLAADPRVIFAAAVDRNGYLPTHNAVYSQPQRPGAPDWNAQHSRHRRLFDDRTGLLAARNTRPHLVQAYDRDMGGGQKILMKEADAPITVQGRHWGGFRIGYRI